MSKRVLVVEDDLLNSMFYNAVLESHDYTVHLVHDGARVLDEVRSFEPDLITMDINLPNVSGVDLIKALQADGKFRHIPIIAITAFAGKGEEDRIRDAGARAYMAKPISVDRLLAAIGRVLSER